VPSVYRRLLQAFPPRPIHDDRQLEATEEQISQLLAVPERTPAQDEYLDLLSDLVRDWEAEQVDIPPVAGIEVVQFLLEQQGLPQRALVPIFGTPSVVSEVLAGRRTLQAKHIEGLAVVPRLARRLLPGHHATGHGADARARAGGMTRRPPGREQRGQLAPA
jgi:HTH-type transcriptional regulator / antitoxin HigA